MNENETIAVDAEAELKRLLSTAGTSAEALHKADEALQNARLAAASAAERSRTRQAMQAALLEESRARETARREVAVADALDALAEEAPVVTVAYAGLTVTIKLAGGLDHIARKTCLEGVRRAIHTIDHKFSERLITTRNALTSGAPVPGESFNVTFIDNLRDELRHLMRHSAVQIER